MASLGEREMTPMIPTRVSALRLLYGAVSYGGSQAVPPAVMLMSLDDLEESLGQSLGEDVRRWDTDRITQKLEEISARGATRGRAVPLSEVGGPEDPPADPVAKRQVRAPRTRREPEPSPAAPADNTIQAILEELHQIRGENAQLRGQLSELRAEVQRLSGDVGAIGDPGYANVAESRILRILMLAAHALADDAPAGREAASRRLRRVLGAENDKAWDAFLYANGPMPPAPKA